VNAYSGCCVSIERVGLIQRILGAPSPEDRARFAEAAAAVDREMAANIELASMWDQTHQAVVFENAAFGRHRGTIERVAPAACALLVLTYDRIPDTESAMERRGPANTIKPDDLALIERWEGDVREAQRHLRDAVTAPSPSVWTLITDRLIKRKRPSVR
jgi:hypothetical protein